MSDDVKPSDFNPMKRFAPQPATCEAYKPVGHLAVDKWPQCGAAATMRVPAMALHKAKSATVKEINVCTACGEEAWSPFSCWIR